MDHESVSQLLGVYVLDACDEDETAEVAAHVTTCDACTKEVAVLGELAGWLGASEAMSPSPQLRARVLDGVERTEDDR